MTTISFRRCLALLTSRLSALLVCLGGVPKLVVKVRQLVAEVRDSFVKVGCLLPGVRGCLAGKPRTA